MGLLRFQFVFSLYLLGVTNSNGILCLFNSLHAGQFFMLLLPSDFSKLNSSENSFKNTIRVSSVLDPDLG